jgi:hypothetical protein
MLHLLNGDATSAVFPSTLPGDRAVWRDIMVEGPAVDDGAARAAWLAPRLGMTPETYARRWSEGQETLARAATEDEVVLWFEQDLFCAVNLWFVLERLPATTPVSLIFPHLTDLFDGLGTLAPEDFTPLFERRPRLDPAMRGEARALWRAYAGADPTTLARTTAGGLPFARRAVRLHFGRFPSTSNGLDDIEQVTLHELVSGPRAFPELFRVVMHDRPLREHGMGDVQYAAALRDLQPLVTIEALTAPFAEWRVALAPDGRDVLGDRLDGLATRLLDRWLGGVHLRPGARLWRFDGSRILRE